MRNYLKQDVLAVYVFINRLIQILTNMITVLPPKKFTHGWPAHYKKKILFGNITAFFRLKHYLPVECILLLMRLIRKLSDKILINFHRPVQSSQRTIYIYHLCGVRYVPTWPQRKNLMNIKIFFSDMPRYCLIPKISVMYCNVSVLSW